jgi:hypothetical protein
MLEHRAVLDQVHPKARQLALAAHGRVGQPDLGHEVAVREDGQHARVDLVGLARQRREALDLGRVGDQHVPAELFEAVVHEPRPGHRLDHPAHRQLVTANATREPDEAAGIGRRHELRNDLAARRKQADIDLPTT